MSDLNVSPYGSQYEDYQCGYNQVEEQANNPAKNNKSVFLKHDKDGDEKVTTKEMGIEKILNNIEKRLPKFAKSGVVGNAIMNIRSVVEKLKGNVNYNVDNFEEYNETNKEIESRIADAKKLSSAVKSLKRNGEKGANKLGEIAFASKAAQGAMDGNYAVVEATAIINDAVKNGLVNKKNEIDLTKLSAKQMPGLTISSMQVQEKYKTITGTDNDKRNADGTIERHIDEREVVAICVYDGKPFEVRVPLKLTKDEGKPDETQGEITRADLNEEMLNE